MLQAKIKQFNDPLAAVTGADVVLSSGSPTGKTTDMHATMDVQPGTAQLHLTAPSNAMPITTVLTNLGFGQYLTEIEN